MPTSSSAFHYFIAHLILNVAPISLDHDYFAEVVVVGVVAEGVSWLVNNNHISSNNNNHKYSYVYSS